MQYTEVPLPTPPVGSPPNPFETWCEWAWWHYLDALAGMSGPTSGVASYKVGSRSLTYQSSAGQGMNLEYWARVVWAWCGIRLPSIGADAARRVILTDT